MPLPRNARLTAVLVALLYGFGLPSNRFQLTHAQTGAPLPAQQRTRTQPSQPAKQKEVDYSQEAVVIEQLSSAYRFEKDGTGQRELTLRVKVQSEAGLERFGQLIFGYSSANEKLDVDFVRVRKASGEVINAALTDIQDLTAPVAREAPVYTDLRQKHVTVPGLRPGDLLEYHLVWHVHTPLALNHFWMEHDFITKGVIVLNDELAIN